MRVELNSTSRQTRPRDATIAASASLSDAVDMQGRDVVGFEMPAAWTTANLTFQVSLDNTTFNDLYDDAGNEETVTAAASRFISVDPVMFRGALYLKVRSGTTGVPVNQAAERVIKVVGKSL